MSVLGAARRSRNALRRSEQALARGADLSEVRLQADAQLTEGWWHQLQAETIGATIAAFPALGGTSSA
ncbi:MAG: hypothetical protein ACRD04_13110 [Terriglobales bacterium]